MTDTVVATVTVGTNPYGVAYGNGFVYVANFSGNSVSVIDASTNTVTATVTVGTSPYGVAYGNGFVYVANDGGNSVSVIDASTNTVTKTVTVGTNPFGVAYGNGFVYVANDGGNSVSVIETATAPSAPTPVSPIAGTTLDASAGVTFTATYNSTDSASQNAYAQRIKQSGAGSYSYWNATSGALQSTIVWNAVSTAPGANWSVTLPGTALSNGNTYNWSMASQEALSNLQGAFAADATFNAQAPPSVTVTAPSGTVATSDAVCSWTTTPAPGAQQTTYRVVLYTQAQYNGSGFQPGVSASTWDSGTVASSAQQAPIGVTLVNGAFYRVYVQVTETGGETSQWQYAAFTVSFDVPAVPALAATASTAANGLPAIQIVVDTHDNLLTEVDASFETGVGSWTAGTNWTVAQAAGTGIDGSDSLVCTRGNTTAGNGYAACGSYTVTQGQPYTAMVSILADTTTTGKQYELYANNSSGANLGHAIVTLGAAGTWTRAIVNFTADSTGTAELLVADDPQTAPASGQIIHMDEAGIFPGTVTTWTRGGLAGTQQVTVLRDDGLYVRGASTANPISMPASQTVTVFDAEVVPTVQHTYTAVSSVVLDPTTTITSATSAATASVALVTAAWWEFDPTDLTTAVSAQVSAYSPQITEQSAAHMVLGQSTLNVIASAMGGVDGTATFETFDTATYMGLSRLLTSQSTVFISDPFGDNQGVTYVRFGPQPGGSSGGSGNKAKSASLQPSTAAAPHHSLEVSWIAAARPLV